MLKSSFEFLEKNRKAFLWICLLYFPLISLTFLFGIGGPYLALHNAWKDCAGAIGEDKAALDAYFEEGYRTIAFSQGFDKAYGTVASTDFSIHFFQGLQTLLEKDYPAAYASCSEVLKNDFNLAFYCQVFAWMNFYGTCALAYFIPLAISWHHLIKRSFATNVFSFIFETIVVASATRGFQSLFALWGWPTAFLFPALSFFSCFLHLLEAYLIYASPYLPFRKVVSPVQVGFGSLFELIMISGIMVLYFSFVFYLGIMMTIVLVLPVAFYELICSNLKCDEYVISLLPEKVRTQKF